MRADRGIERPPRLRPAPQRPCRHTLPCSSMRPERLGGRDATGAVFKRRWEAGITKGAKGAGETHLSVRMRTCAHARARASGHPQRVRPPWQLRQRASPFSADGRNRRRTGLTCQKGRRSFAAMVCAVCHQALCKAPLAAAAASASHRARRSCVACVAPPGASTSLRSDRSRPVDTRAIVRPRLWLLDREQTSRGCFPAPRHCTCGSSSAQRWSRGRAHSTPPESASVSSPLASVATRDTELTRAALLPGCRILQPPARESKRSASKGQRVRARANGRRPEVEVHARVSPQACRGVCVRGEAAAMLPVCRTNCRRRGRVGLGFAEGATSASAPAVAERLQNATVRLPWKVATRSIV